MRYKLIILLVSGLLAFAASAFAQGEPNLKIGLNSVSMQDMGYTHDTGTERISTTGTMVGTELFLEYLVSEYFGFELDYTTSPLERNYDLEIKQTNTFISDNVTETATYYTYGFNLYLDKAFAKGLNTWVGVATGAMTVVQEFEGGSLGDKSATHKLNLDVVRAGVDWSTEVAGFRARAHYQVAKNTTTKAIEGVKQTMDYSGPGFSVGVFAKF